MPDERAMITIGFEPRLGIDSYQKIIARDDHFGQI
jgi:hypothetical protein